MAKVEEDRETKLKRLRKEFGIVENTTQGKTPPKEIIKEEPKAITQAENLGKVLEETSNFLEGVWQGLITPLEDVYKQAALGGRELGQGKIGEGVTDVLHSVVKGLILPATVPLGGVTGGLNTQGEIGKEVSKGVVQPFENLGWAINEGSKLTKQALEKAGMKIYPDAPVMKKIDNLSKEVAMLYMLGKSNKVVKDFVKSELPSISIQRLNEIKDLKTKEAIQEKKDLLRVIAKEKKAPEQVKEQSLKVEEAIKKTEPEKFKIEEPIKDVKETLTIPPEGVGLEKLTDLKPETPKSEVGKTPKASSDINKKLVEKGFEELPPEELAKYTPITKEATVKKATDLLESNPDKAKNIATGKETSPELSPSDQQVLFNAVKNKAIEKGDAPTLKELALSPIAKQRSEAAQTLGASGFNNGQMGSLDPVKAIQEVVKTREESPTGKRSEIITKEYETKIKSLEDKLLQQEERITKIETEKSYKKILREESANIRKQKRQVNVEVLDKEFTDIIGEFVKSYKPNVAIDPAQIKILLKTVRNRAQKGITNAEQVIDDIYVALADKIDGITRKDIRDAISGYGRTTIRTKDELAVQVADLKRQMTLASRIEDLETGKLPFKKEINRNEPSAELKDLKTEFKTKLKESDLIDQENLAKNKENIQKRINEINNKILEGDYIKPERKVPTTDLQKEKLQKELKETRDKWNDIQKNLGEKISDEEVKTIAELSKKTNDAKVKLESAPKRELLRPQTKEEQAYGDAYTDYIEYIDGLKEKADAMTWKEFRESPLANTLKGIGHIPGMSKSLKATFDNSGLFNQNILTLYTHPWIWQKNARKSFQDIWNTLGGKNVMKMVNSDKVSRENYRNGNYKKDKLAIGTVEEAFPDSKLLEKTPVLGRVHKAANTAFTALAYRNRMDIYDLLTEHAKNLGYKETTGLGFGKIVNSLTGRGSLGRFENGADAFNVLMFAPRFLKSHVDVLTAHLFSKDISPLARKEVAKNLMKIIGGISAISVASNAVKPGTVEFDTRSTDFLKIKVGDTRFNYTGGLAPIITLVARIVTGETKNSKGEIVKFNSGKYGARTTYDVLIDFMKGKASPIAGTVLNELKGQTFSGERLTLGNRVENLTMPLPINNYLELTKNPNSANILVATIADALGLFTNTYSSDPELRKVKNIILRADKEKLSRKQRVNFNHSLFKALVNKSITRDQYDQYKQQFLELQTKAPKKEIK